MKLTFGAVIAIAIALGGCGRPPEALASPVRCKEVFAAPEKHSKADNERCEQFRPEDTNRKGY